MKKNLLIGFLSLVSIASMTLALIQRTEAQKQKASAEANAILAREAQEDAQKQKEQAELARREAQTYLHLRVQALEKQAK